MPERLLPPPFENWHLWTYECRRWAWESRQFLSWHQTVVLDVRADDLRLHVRKQEVHQNPPFSLPLTGDKVDIAKPRVVHTYLQSSTNWAVVAFGLLTIMEALMPGAAEMSGLVLVASHVSWPIRLWQSDTYLDGGFSVRMHCSWLLHYIVLQQQLYNCSIGMANSRSST